MEGKGAVVFLPREDGRFNWMLEELMFAPPAVWMAEALRAEGFEKFLVVCHDDDRQAAQACFPEGTGYVTTGATDARERLAEFLSGLTGRVAVVTQPVYLNAAAAAYLADDGAALPRGESCGVFRVDSAALKDALDAGADFDAVLREKGEAFGQPYGQFLGIQPLSRGMDWLSAQSFAHHDGVSALNRALTTGRGVIVVDPANTYVGPQVTVGDGTVLHYFAGEDRHRPTLRDRPQFHGPGLHHRGRGDGERIPAQREPGGRRREDRPLCLHPAQLSCGGQREGGRLCGAEELRHRRGHEDLPSHLCGRFRRGAAGQLRLRHRHRQL